MYVLISILLLSAASAKELPVFGYLPEYRLSNYNYSSAFDTGLTHLIFFSLEVDAVSGAPSALDRLPPKTAAKRAREAADATSGKLLIGFGGNARSAGFGPMVKSSLRRSTFLRELQKLFDEFEFDGVDYNWEYPSNAEEWRLWRVLMEETKKLSTRSGPPLVTFTMYLDPNHGRVIQQFQLLEIADFVHCMAYDMHGEHSTIPFAESALSMVEKFAIPRNKFTLGLPFYARHVETGNPKTYAELLPHIKRKKPDAWSGVDRLGKYFLNSQATIRKKTEFACRSKLGGVMIWELGQDVLPHSRADSLLSAVRCDAEDGPEL